MTNAVPNFTPFKFLFALGFSFLTASSLGGHTALGSYYHESHPLIWGEHGITFTFQFGVHPLVHDRQPMAPRFEKASSGSPKVVWLEREVEIFPTNSGWEYDEVSISSPDPFFFSSGTLDRFAASPVPGGGSGCLLEKNDVSLHESMSVIENVDSGSGDLHDSSEQVQVRVLKDEVGRSQVFSALPHIVDSSSQASEALEVTLIQQPIPEPSVTILLSLGILCLLARSRISA